MKSNLLLSALLTTASWGQDHIFSIEGYGEAYYISQAHDRSEGLLRFTVEPSLALSKNVTLHAHIGYEHPSEKGGWQEVELEALSLDARLTDNTLISLGKMHIPIGMYNLYHEPIYFLTIEPSRVEHLIIPTEWHETAALVSYTLNDITITGGAITPMDGSKLQRSTWLLDGKEEFLTGGKRPGWLLRVDHGTIDTTLIGASAVTVPLIGTDAQATLIEAHASTHLSNGWEGTLIASKGWINNVESVNALTGTNISKNTQGISLTVGYDIGRMYQQPEHTVLLFGHSEYAMPSDPLTPLGQGGTAHSVGADWFISPKIVAKTEFRHSNHEGDQIGIGLGFVY